jgi:Tetracyclin repressor-like, C-terminal domain
MDSYQLYPQRKNDCLRLQREPYDIYMKQLQRLCESKIVDDINLTVVNFVIFGMINWVYQWYKDDKSLTEEEVANQMIKILLSGILKPIPWLAYPFIFHFAKRLLIHSRA